MLDTLKAFSEELHQLERSKPNAKARARVMEALHSKHEGLQSQAATLLGQWGGHDSVAALQELFVRVQSRPQSQGLRNAVIRALAACITGQEASWALDQCFNTQSLRQSTSALHLLWALPAQAVLPRVTTECANPNPVIRRLAVQSLTYVPLDLKKPLLLRLAQDTDAEVRRYSRVQLAAPSNVRPAT